MTLVMEDGTGLPTANSFIGVAGADAYHTLKGNSIWTGATDDKEAALIRASSFLTTAYSWQGNKVGHRAQSLAWPRSGVIDKEGYSVDYESVPQEILDATCEVALRELITPNSMTPDVTLADKVKREKVGSLEVEYLNGNTSANASRPILSIVDALITGLTSSNGNVSAISGRVERS